MPTFKNPSGAIAYRVSGSLPDGKRIRRNFRTMAEALGAKQIQELKAINQGTPEKMRRTGLRNEQLREAEQAFEDLNGKPLKDAVRYYLHHYRKPVNTRTLAEAMFIVRMLSSEEARKIPSSLLPLAVFIVKVLPVD